MEDEVITTSAPESDVVMTANTSPENTAGYSTVQETNQTLPPVEGALSENPVTPEQPGITQAPKTEREAAIDYIEYNKDHSYTNRDNGVVNWIRNHYNYDPNVAGTMWVAGKINDVNTQMSFLEATLNESMYDEMDLQRYYFDQNLATARAYAQQKKFETAYGFYRAAQEKALAEGELTGWYMPAEGTYMLGQWTIADEILKDPNASDSDKARAQSVYNSTTKWFEANNITERGIKCLNMMYLEETIRHNKEMENLQEQANEIQRKANEANRAAAGASYDLQLREFNYDTAKMELQYGADLDENGVIGFKNSDFVTSGFKFKDFESIFGSYDSQFDWAISNPTQAFMVTNRAYMKEVLGDHYNSAFNSYMEGVQNSSWLEAQAKDGATYIKGENIDSLTNTKLKISELESFVDEPNLVKDATIKIIRTGNDKAQLWVFDKNGTGYQITNDNLKLVDGTTIKDVLTEQGLKLDKTDKPYLSYTNEKGKTVDLYIGKRNLSSYETSVSKTDSKYYTDMSEKQHKLYTQEEKKGNSQAHGIVSIENVNQAFVLKEETDDGIVYKEVNDDGIKGIKDEGKILDVHLNTDGTYTITRIDGKELTSWQESHKNAYYQLALKQTELIGYINNYGETIEIYGYTNSDGSVIPMMKTEGVDISGLRPLGPTTMNSVDALGLDDDTIIIMSTKELTDNNFKPRANESYTIDTYIDNRINYVNGYKDYSVDSNTPTELVDANEKENEDERADNAATIKSGFNSSGNYAAQKFIEDHPVSKKDKDKIQINKYEYKDTNFDALLGEHGETLFTQEQIIKKNKGLLEDRSYLEGNK